MTHGVEQIHATAEPGAPVIRPMALEDYDGVYALWTRTEGLDVNDLDQRDQLEAFLRRNPDMSQVALWDGRVVGAILCGHDGRMGLLHRLAVDRDCRRRGIGRAMVEACLECLRSQGIRVAFLFVYHTNPQGLAFWEASGWRSASDCAALWKNLRPSAQWVDKGADKQE